MLRALGKTPNDPLVEEMSDAQWLWAYRNVIKDDEEDFLRWEHRIDLLLMFMNSEAAKNYINERDSMRGDTVGQRSNRNKKDFNTNLNTEFELELKAIQLGYNPNSGITPKEFLASLEQANSNTQETVAEQEQKEQTPELDLMNASFDDLVNSGMFEVIHEEDTTVRGDQRESQDSFLSRVLALSQGLDVPETSEDFDPHMPIPAEEGMSTDGFEDDLDVIEVDED